MRKALDLTQQEFADRLCIKRNTVATYETGKSNPSDAAVILICKTFDVSETWLRTGDGEMFVPSPRSELDALAAKYPQMTHETYVFIEKLAGLPESAQNTIMGFLKEVVDSFGDVEFGTRAFPGQSASVSEPLVKQPLKMSDAELHAELDRQLAEQKKREESGSAYGRGGSGTVAG